MLRKFTAAVVVLSSLGRATFVSAAPDFNADVRPLLQNYCTKCHGAEKTKGGVNFEVIKSQEQIDADPKRLEKIVRLLHDREMPPPGKPQPKAAELDRLLAWGEYTLNHLDYDKIPKDPGRVVIHRLSRAEYNNTIRDLFGVDLHPADNFPSDGSGGGGFDNNADTLFIPPILMERYLVAAAEIANAVPANRLLISKPGLFTPARTAARKIFNHYATLAFRKPASDGDIDPLLRIFKSRTDAGDSFEKAVRFTLKGILVSAHFLFRIEHDEPDAEPHRVNNYELASRLSYFIWSSMPDAELFRLADQQRLHEPDILKRQINRMLLDPNAKALAENFASQWLRIRELNTTTQPDPKRFARFTPALRDAMYREPIEFFDAVLHENRSVVDLLDADFTFVNGELAKHYGLSDVDGEEFQRVSLDDRRRGGVLTMAGVLTVTSYPQRTSPVLRGKWVLEEILGAPTPPPPPNAGGLPADDRPRNGLTFRERLEQHRNKPECASCHGRMDPLGFGLENFDAIGRWRTEVGGKPIDCSGKLATGEAFSGPAELKKLLLSRKKEFVRNLSEKMLAYALGRGLEYYDTPAVKTIVDALEANDYRSSVLVTAIAQSYPFQYRRGSTKEEGSR